MVNNAFLQSLDLCLERLDPTEWTKVRYDSVNYTIDLIQRGKLISVRPLQGLLLIKHTEALLAPNQLEALRRDIQVMIQYPDIMLFAPKDLGFNVYVRDLKIYDKPRLFTELNFYSIKNKFYLWYLKLTNKRIKLLMNIK